MKILFQGSFLKPKLLRGIGSSLDIHFHASFVYLSSKRNKIQQASPEYGLNMLLQVLKFSSLDRFSYCKVQSSEQEEIFGACVYVLILQYDFELNPERSKDLGRTCPIYDLCSAGCSFCFLYKATKKMQAHACFLVSQTRISHLSKHFMSLVLVTAKIFLLSWIELTLF